MISETVFVQAFRVIVGVEGGFTNAPTDPGNWTGGRCGAGLCVGTNFGISAAAYPAVDIVGLTLEEARVIYRRDYWEPMQGDALPAPLALLVFDAAVNNGVGRAIGWLQQAVGVPADGLMGRVTMAAVAARAGTGAEVLAEFQARRVTFMAGLPTWRTFGLGWARRLCRMPFEAVRMGGV